MDYYGLMFRPLRLLSALTLVAALASHSTFGANANAAQPDNSALDRDLFYEMLVGELSAQAGDSGSAYALMLDAARKSNAPRLYERAVELAVGARNGEAALDAARAWSRAFPASQDANRTMVHILVGMNRIADVQEPIKRHLAVLPLPDRTSVISLLPRYFSRATDKKQVASVMEHALTTELTNPTSGPAAWSTLGLLRLQAGDSDGALESVQRASLLDPSAEPPAFLALAMMGPKVPEAEAFVLKFLMGKASPELRMTYVRNLLDAQRLKDAYVAVQVVTRESPAFADGWLVQGSLEFQNQNLTQAESSLLAYADLHPAANSTAEPQEMGRGLVQAFLLLAQLSEQTRRYEDAQKYLDRIVSPRDALRVAIRSASILARQGKLEEARKQIRAAPEMQPEDERAKVSAEVQLLRDYKQYQLAYLRLVEAIEQFPQDSDLLYDQAMLAEKLGKADEMERLLRQLMALKPDYHHAYNALGFSLAERNIRLQEARELISKALEIAPEDPFIVDSLAWVEFRAGKLDEALRLLQGAYQKRPDAEIAAHMGEVLWKLGQREQALVVWRQGAALNPDNETLLETTMRLQSKP